MADWWNTRANACVTLPCDLPRGGGSLQFLRTREGGVFYWVIRREGRQQRIRLGETHIEAGKPSGMTPETARSLILEKLGVPTDSPPAKGKRNRTRDASAREILRATEAAEFLGVSRSTFWRLSTSGALPAGKLVGKRARVWSRKQLEAWVLEGAH